MSREVFRLPSPEGKFLVGHLTEMNHARLAFLTKCVREYGEIVPLRLGSTPALLLNHPDYIEQVLQDRKLFVKGQTTQLRFLLGEGLITSEGESWFHQRRLTQPVFHHQRITAYGEVIVTHTEQMLATWQDEEIRDIHADMMHLTLSIVMKTIFNIELAGGDAQNISRALDMARELFGGQLLPGFFRSRQWLPTPTKRRYTNALQAMDETIYSLIRQRRQSVEQTGDLLWMLMQARDETDGSGMTDKQLRDEIATLMVAGHETTANSLAWTWMLLSEHPEVQTRLQAELKQVLGESSLRVTDLPNLRYTDMLIKESMRLYPPVPMMGRQAAKDCEIGGYLVPAGCRLLMSQWAMHRHPRYFDTSDESHPERWADDLEKRLPRGAYFPFGEGPRVCIGKSFALMEAVLILATIAQRFQVTLIPEFPVVPKPYITLRPEYGIQVKLSELSTQRSA